MKNTAKVLIAASLVGSGTLVPTPLQAVEGRAKAMQSQNEWKVKGTVIDATTGEPVIGATIVQKGTTSNGTITDYDGNFSFDLTEKGATISISYVGYITQDIVVDSEKRLVIKLQEDTQKLDEVVVVGFGTQKKENLTGAMSVVKMEDALGDRPVTSIGSALQGAIPGLVITGSSVPGESKSFNIRGATSITGGEPLILVDNVPADIDLVNPEDIESVSVLKDAASAAIYGARAAFGVILITTKKGKKNQRIKLNYNNNFGFNKATNLAQQASVEQILQTHLDWDNDGLYYAQDQNLKDWIGYVQDYNQNPSKYPANGIYSPEGENKYYYLKDTDPQRAIFDNFGFQQTHNISASGGSDKIVYRMAAGYTDTQGPLITDKDNFDRINVTSYVSGEITDWLTQALDFRYARSNRSYVQNDGRVYNTNFPAFYPEGEIALSGDPNGPKYPVNTPKNHLLLLEPNKFKHENPRVYSRTLIEPLEGLSAVIEYTFDRRIMDKKQYSDPFQMTNTQMGLLWSSNPAGGRYQQQKKSIDYNSLNAFATYEFDIAEKHNFKVMAGYSQESRKYEELWAQKDDMINPDMPSFTGSTGVTLVEDKFRDYSIRSGFYRVNYNFLGRYLLEANGRYDGSSKFPTDTRFGVFPSFSAGWQVAEEPWMKWSRDWLDVFKLRASWGQIGNQDIQEYAYLETMDSYQAHWISGGKRPITLLPPDMVRQDFTWEVVETTDIGFDFNFLRNRLFGTFDWYQRDTKGMLVPGAEFPSVVGTPAPKQNAGDMRTRGWELAVSWRDKIGDWGYNVGFNIYDSKSVITKYDNEVGLFNEQNPNDPNAPEKDRYRVGMELGEIWGYVTERYYTIDDFQDGWQNGVWKLKEGVTTIKGNDNIRPGDIMYKNLRDDPENGSINQIDNGRDNVYDPGDRTIIGNTTPRYQFGANLGVNYKGFDLSVFLQGTGKRDAWLSGDMRFPLSYGSFGTVYSHQLDYWKPIDPENGNWNPINPNPEFPRLYDEAKNAGSNNRRQTAYLVDASYVRLQNVTLGYTFPKAIVQKLHLTGLKVFASGENLYTWDHLPKGYDSERLSWGYPIYATYSFGINVTL